MSLHLNFTAENFRQQKISRQSGGRFFFYKKAPNFLEASIKMSMVTNCQT